MEQTDQALANTLDTLRETGAAAGGATAIANAALKSKQGISASIEKQEAQNQRLQAQGQLQVDIAKGKGETIRMEAQELRDTNELNRLQAQSDMAQYTRDMSIQTGLSALGDAATVRNAGIVPEQKDKKDKGVASAADTNTNNMGPVNYDYGDPDLTSTTVQASQLNYTGGFSDISDDVKIRDGKMQAPPGWNEQEAQNRINSWYSMKKENNLANK